MDAMKLFNRDYESMSACALVELLGGGPYHLKGSLINVCTHQILEPGDFYLFRSARNLRLWIKAWLASTSSSWEHISNKEAQPS